MTPERQMNHEFSLERLIRARKMRTHCAKWSAEDALNEVVGLYNKYYLPKIDQMVKELKKSKRAKKVDA